ncbi:MULTISPECIES: AMP-binding protein [unclassified Mesorhizobium]|uniref:AMP-binding protein n=1 Tax=unclassified Mesorhizobium TaxID=325217 RepID=UPI0005693A78|nr:MULTISPECIES: AMP-binding protein [unclassified Mesorhizobium]
MAQARADRTLLSCLDHYAGERPDGLFLIGPGNEQTTYGGFWAAAGTTATAMLAHGVRAGERVVTICENSIELFVVIVAAWRIGATVVPLNPSLGGDLLDEVIARAEPSLVVVENSSAEIGRATDITDLLIRDGCANPPASLPGPAADALIIFSSGTTGKSKGCVLSHGYLAFFGREFSAMAGLGAGDRVFCVTALYHVNAFWAFAGSVVNGTPHAFEKRFSASTFWQRSSEVEATIFDYVGAILAILLRSAGERTSDNRLRACLGGGVRTEDLVQFEKRFHCNVLEGYGLTECCQPIYQTEHDRRHGSIGRTSIYFDARVVDEHDQDVLPGTPGQLLLRSRTPDGLFRGYWRDPEQTRAAFKGKWFATRDLVTQDQDGYFYFIERLGHVVRRRGENVSCFQVEGVFASHPMVQLATAVGVPAELGDEEILLAVELVDGATMTPQELLGWGIGKLPKFMHPRYVRIGILPRTASQRVERHRVRSIGLTADTYDSGAVT